MSSAPRSRSTRDRPAKAPLSEAVVVDAGLRILQRDGLDAVTMRRVATELDTGPASLYVYVDGRDGLCRAMLNRVVAAVPLETPDPQRWREQLHALLGGLLAALDAHPGIARASLADVPTGEHALRMIDTLLGTLRAGGIDGRPAAWAAHALLMLVTTSAIETATYREREGARSEAELLPRIGEALAALPTERFPHLTALSPELARGDTSARVAFTVDTLVDGLLAEGAR